VGKRKAISKKIRFEIFKRDSFTCQYCGKSAPDVILNVEHINPVAKGGENDLLNLITACLNCNQGKGTRTLSDSTTIEKQKKQLDELNSRREQLEMMMKWKEGMKSLEQQSIDYAVNYWNEKIKRFNFKISDMGVQKIGIYIRKFSLNEILSAIDIAIDTYVYRFSNSVNNENIEEAFNKIPGICHNKKHNPHAQEIAYLSGILNNRLYYYNPENGKSLLKEVFKKGYDFETLKDIILNSQSWTNFRENIEYLLENNK
jgi:hypothetical protein